MAGRKDVVEMEIMKKKCEEKEAYSFRKPLCEYFRSLRNVHYV
jgi:hypothetical protein